MARKDGFGRDNAYSRDLESLLGPTARTDPKQDPKHPSFYGNSVGQPPTNLGGFRRVRSKGR